MPEETVPAPAAAESAPEGGPDSAVAAGGVVDDASAGSGSAPGAGDDARAGDAAADAQAAATATTPAEYQFLKRKFRDQKHAEEVLGSEVGKVRGMQRKAAELEKQLQQRESEIQTLRNLAQQGPVQGAAQDQKSSGPPSFADELANSGELELFAKIAQDPEMGMGHAMYAMAQAFDKRLTSAMEQVQSEAIQPLIRRQDGAEKMARVFSTVKEMSTDFPELVDYGENTPDDVAEAQQTILGMLEQLPPEWLANKPKDALWFTVMKYREQHGTPVFAQPPGTSESPSALVAAAAEKAAKASSATPLDGSGVPRQGSKGPETPADRWRRESSQLRKEATTPSGRKLGFAEPV